MLECAIGQKSWNLEKAHIRVLLNIDTQFRPRRSLLHNLEGRYRRDELTKGEKSPKTLFWSCEGVSENRIRSMMKTGSV